MHCWLASLMSSPYQVAEKGRASAWASFAQVPLREQLLACDPHQVHKKVLLYHPLLHPRLVCTPAVTGLPAALTHEDAGAVTTIYFKSSIASQLRGSDVKGSHTSCR